MYALTYNNQVFLTPVKWSPRYISGVIEDDYGLSVSLLVSDEDRIPFDITPEIRVLPVTEVIPDINGLTEMLSGGTWEVTLSMATVTYTATNHPIELVRQRVKELLASKRYDKESAGIKLNIQGSEVSVETDRDTRNLFVQAFMLMGDTDTRNWKFPEGFMELSKTDLGSIVAAGATFVQQAFDWESGYIDRINIADYSDLIVIKDELDPPMSVGNIEG
jgi:hypothetical protein